MKLLKSIILIFTIVLTGLISGCNIGGTGSQDVFANEVSADTLKNTIVTPYFEYKTDQSKNIVFSSTFQMAWNELKESVVKGNIKLNNEPPLVGFLNVGKPSKKDLSDKDHVALAGLQKDNIIKRINDELKIKFKEGAPTVSSDTLKSPDDILAYAYLFKNLKFKHTFEALKKPIEFYNGTKIKAFGIDKYSLNEKHDKLGKQVDIYGYRYDENDKRYSFVVKLYSESQNDEIVLASIKPKETLIDTVGYVSGIVEKEQPVILGEGDRLAIPVINFNLLKSYDELMDKNLLNTGFTDYRIAQALQSIKFKLDEKGAVLKSESKVGLEKWSGGDKHKSLIFNEPFLIYLKEKNADYPYFAMWVNNTELLTEAK
jgi:hypothetical protein